MLVLQFIVKTSAFSKAVKSKKRRTKVHISLLLYYVLEMSHKEWLGRVRGVTSDSVMDWGNTCQVLTICKGVEVRCHYRQLHIPPAKKVPRYSFPWAMLVKGYHSLQAVETVKWYTVSKLRNMECRTQSLPSSAFTFPDNMGTHELLDGQEKFSCSALTTGQGCFFVQVA